MVFEYIVLFIVLLALQVLFIKHASRFNLLDRSNVRSSHIIATPRGGGFVIPFSLILYAVVYGNYDPFLLGLAMLSIVSFIDDFRGLANRWRIIAQFCSVVLLLLSVYNEVAQIWILLFLLIFSIGMINAVNFMDGINGMSVAFGMVFITTLIYLNNNIQFVDQELLIYAGMGVFSFAIFNFRAKALCFAGDVGSISLGFLLVYLSLLFYYTTANISVLAFWIVYGVDSVITIIYRLIKKENIFIAHRSHLYQYLANELNISHIKIATAYGLLQVLINSIVIYNFNVHVITDINLLLLLIISTGLVYLVIRTRVLKKISLGN